MTAIKFNLRLSFPILACELDQVERTIFSLANITRLHGRAKASGVLNLCLVAQFPMAIELDGETWRTVDRAKKDSALIIVQLRHADLPDGILLALAETDEHVRAAQWAVAHNDWFTEMRRF